MTRCLVLSDENGLGKARAVPVPPLEPVPVVGHGVSVPPVAFSKIAQRPVEQAAIELPSLFEPLALLDDGCCARLRPQHVCLEEAPKEREMGYRFKFLRRELLESRGVLSEPIFGCHHLFPLVPSLGRQSRPIPRSEL